MTDAHRDIFVSHRSADKDLVRTLVADIESNSFDGRKLMCWFDEAEIRPGESIPGLVNRGLEISRFFAVVLTPDYFAPGSGWTDAEWHAALHTDPDNRSARIIPLLLKDCPYIPPLLIHLKAIDMREKAYSRGLEELLVVLRDQPLPRPTTHRGQLITSSGMINRKTLLAERSVPQAFPDAVEEQLFCNLLPVEQLPPNIYIGAIAESLLTKRDDGSYAKPSKTAIKQAIRGAQIEAGLENPFMPAFRTFEDRIISFHDLESPDGALAAVIDENDVEVLSTKDLLVDEDDRRLVTGLLNMSISRHAFRRGLKTSEDRQHRYHFPPKNGGENVIEWRPAKRNSKRSVAKPCVDKEDGTVKFWRHQGAYLKMLFLANRFYLQINPTWIITEDGTNLMKGPKVTRLVNRWTGPERNLQVLYHVRFWSKVLNPSSGPISVRTGDQWMQISQIPASIREQYGIRGDQKDLLGLLDEEASQIAEAEDEMIEAVTQLALEAESAFDESIALEDGLIGDLDEDEEDGLDE